MRAFAVLSALRYALVLGGIFLVWKLGWSGDELSFTWTFAEGLLFLALALEVGVQVAWREAREIARWAREHFDFGLRSVLSAVLLGVLDKMSFSKHRDH